MSAPDVDRMTDDQVAGLVAAIFPTRFEQALEVAAKGAWWLGKRLDAAGDAIDDVRSARQRRRAEQRRHLAGRRP